MRRCGWLVRPERAAVWWFATGQYQPADSGHVRPGWRADTASRSTQTAHPRGQRDINIIHSFVSFFFPVFSPPPSGD